MAFRLNNVLAMAAASIKVGHVFMIDGQPIDWGSSRTSSDSAHSGDCDRGFR